MSTKYTLALVPLVFWLAACATTSPTSTRAPAATTAATAAPAAPVAVALPAATPVAAAKPLVLTPEQTEGPYYVASPPQRAQLRAAASAAPPLFFSGRVLDASGQPIAGAKVDLWQADENGAYDNTKGYRYRGYVVTDAQGRYEFETVVPGLYPGRTAHIHVKVTPPGGKTLTTQVYFPTAAATNQRDNIFDARLLATLEPAASGQRALFDFVVAR